MRPPRSKSTVLVVEDDAFIRMMAVDIIENAGFETVEAVDADRAIEILCVRKDIRIVFTDIDMPGSMDGMKLARAIRDRWPPIELILTSGLIRPRSSDLPKRAVFLPKPYASQALTNALGGFDRAS